MFELREKTTTTHDDNNPPPPPPRPSSLSDSVLLQQQQQQSGVGSTKRRKTETGLAAEGGSGAPWGVGNSGSPGTGLLSMREFFEAGGRSYEAYLEVCKDRRDKVVSKTTEDQVITSSSQTMTQLTRSVTADDCVLSYRGGGGNSATKVRSNGTEQSQMAKSTATSFGFFSADDKSLAMMSPEASLPTTSGRSPPEAVAAAATSGQCLTSEIIDKVIAVGLKTPLNELPRFSAPCNSPLAVKETVERPFFTFTPSPRSAAAPGTVDIASLFPPGTSIVTALRAGSPVVNFPLSAPPRSPPNYGEDGVFRFSIPGKRKCPFEGDPPCAIDLSCKRQKPSEAGRNRREYEAMTPPPPDDVFEADDRSSSTAVNRSSAGSAPRVTSYAQSATIFSDVTRWSVEQVVRYVASIPGCRDYAETFRQEQIDGACLIHLTERHLLGVIKMKLGPAIRLLQAISSLCMNTSMSSSSSEIQS